MATVKVDAHIKAKVINHDEVVHYWTGGRYAAVSEFALRHYLGTDTLRLEGQFIFVQGRKTRIIEHLPEEHLYIVERTNSNDWLEGAHPPAPRSFSRNQRRVIEFFNHLKEMGYQMQKVADEYQGLLDNLRKELDMLKEETEVELLRNESAIDLLDKYGDEG
jgi:hypothetical protein